MNSNDFRRAPAAATLVALCARAELGLHLRLAAVLDGRGDARTARILTPLLTQTWQRYRELAGGRGDADPAAHDEAVDRWTTAATHLVGSPTPVDWAESMVSTAVGRELLTGLEEAAGVVVTDELALSVGAQEAATRLVQEAITTDPTLVGRLSLYGRRCFGRVLLAGAEIRRTLGAEADPALDAARPRIGVFFDGAGDVFAARMAAMGLNG